MANRLDKLIIGGLLATVIFTPLAHGAVEPWSIAVFELLIVLLMLLWAVKCVMDKRIVITVPITAYPIGAFLLYGLIQSITRTDSEGNLTSLSIDPEATRVAVTVLFFLLAAHVIAANFFNSTARLNVLVHFLMIFGFALALLGMIQLVTGNGDRLFFRPVQSGSGFLTGPFVNHNHFAGYIELLIPLPIAFIITGVQRQYRILYGFSAVMMAVALILTASRAGMISLAAGILFALLLGVNYNSRMRRSSNAYEPNAPAASKRTVRRLLSGLAVLGLAAAAVFVGTVWLGLGPVLDRVVDNSLISNDAKAETFESSRGWIWKTTGNMIWANPVFGIGLGSYETAYPLYSDKDQTQIVDRAHNDYLQLLSDTGLIGGVIGLGFLLMFVYNVMRLARCKDRISAAIAIGGAAAIVSVLVHSLFDFNLQIPSTALLFLVLNAVLSYIVFSTVESKQEARQPFISQNSGTVSALGVSS